MSVAEAGQEDAGGGSRQLVGGGRDRIEVIKEGGKARGKAGAGIWAEARMRVREKFQGRPGPMALLELQPKTGRTHQLRIQCANRGLPIVGDRTYGDFQRNRERKGERLFLHAESIALGRGAGEWVARREADFPEGQGAT